MTTGIDQLSRYRVQIEMNFVDTSDSVPSTGTKYISNFDHGVEANGGPYRAILLNSIYIDQRLDSVGFGVIRVARQSDMDPWLTYAWKGHDVKIFVYAPGSTTRTPWFYGYNAGISNSTLTYIEFGLNDRKAFFDKPLLTQRIVDGNSNELLLPLTLGYVFNVPAMYFNNRYYYDYYKPGTSELVNVKDNGINIQSDPENSVYAGGYRWFVFAGNKAKRYNKTGYVSAAEQVYGTVTVDIKEPHKKSNQQAEYLAALAGFTVDQDSMLDTNFGEYGGYWFTDPDMTIREAIDQVCANGLLFWRTDNFNDVVYLGKIRLPNDVDPIDLVVTADDIVHDSMTLIETRPAVTGVNHFSAFNNHVFDPGDIADAVTDSEKAELTREWVASSTYANPNGEYYPASEWINAYHHHVGDYVGGVRARTRAAPSYVYEFETTQLPQIGQHIKVTYPVDSFETGRSCRVVGVKQFVDSPIYQVKIWVGAEVTASTEVDTTVQNHLILQWFVDKASGTCKAINSITINDQSEGYATSTEAAGDVNNVALPVAGHTGVTYANSGKAGQIVFRHDQRWEVSELVVAGTDYRASLVASGEWSLIFETDGSNGGYDEVSGNFVAGFDDTDTTNPYQVILNVDNATVLPAVTSLAICAEIQTTAVTQTLDIRWDVAASTLDYETALAALAPVHRWKLDDGAGGGGGSYDTQITSLNPDVNYPVDEASGNFTDTINAQTGTVTGSITYSQTAITPQTSSTSSVTSAGGYVDFAAPTTEDNRTWNLWVKNVTNAAGAHCVATLNNGAITSSPMIYSREGNWRISHPGAGEVTGSAIDNTATYMLTMVHHRSTNQMLLYVNGVLDITANFTGGVNNNTFRIAANSLNSETVTAGYDQISSFPTALTAQQITDLYTSTIAAGEVVASLNPFAFWKLGEASGTTANDELGNNNGTYIGSPTLGVASLNLASSDTCVTMDGNTQRVEITAFDPGTTSYSLTFLMNLDVDWLAEGFDRYFMSFITADFNGFRVYYHNSSKGLRIDIGTGGSYTTIAVADYFTPKQNKTYSVTITVTPSTVNVYIDGQLFGTGSGVTTTWAGSSYAFMFADIYFGQSRFFVGQLDEVAFFDKELTAQNALDIYNDAINNAPDGQLSSVTALSPVGYYPMQETSGTTATDEGPNSLNGTYNTGVTVGLPGHRFTGKAPYFSPSNGGGAMTLSGSRTHLEFAGNFSISFIFRGRGAGGGLRRFVSVGGVNGYTAQIQSSQLRLRVANGEMQTQNTFDNHRWHHVVMVYTGGDGNGKIYVDGVDETWFDSTNTTPDYTDTETSIGVASLPLYCDLSHFAFYSTALTAQNALDLYNGSGV